MTIGAAVKVNGVDGEEFWMITLRPLRFFFLGIGGGGGEGCGTAAGGTGSMRTVCGLCGSAVLTSEYHLSGVSGPVRRASATTPLFRTGLARRVGWRLFCVLSETRLLLLALRIKSYGYSRPSRKRFQLKVERDSEIVKTT